MKIIFLLLLLSAISLGKNQEIISKLKQNIEKMDNSILITKGKMKSPKEVEFLPDIYFSLAELLVEKSRYMFALKLELNNGTPMDEVDFTAEKRVKLEAIETLKSLVDRYPKYPNRDKALFAIGHEYRELNDNTTAVKFYKEIIEKYPESAFWQESQYLIGLMFFEKKDYEYAKMQLQKIIAKGMGPFLGMAYYKIGECEIFLDQYLSAMLSFEKAIDIETKLLNERKDSKKDLREEILIASVVPYVDLLPQDLSLHPRFLNPLEYYQQLAYDKVSFRSVLSRLGKRFSIKSRFYDAVKVYYELMKIASDPQVKKDAFESYYLSMKQAKKDYFPETIAEDLNTTLRWLKFHNISYQKYEPAIRDIATKLHQNSNSTRRVEDYRVVSKLYNQYLQFFPKSKFARDMRLNLAEVLYKAEEYIEASLNYYQVARSLKKGPKSSELFQSSLDSLERIFVISSEVSSLEKFQSRLKYREIGESYLQLAPSAAEAARVSFNIAKTYYDDKNFEMAIKNLKDFAFRYTQFPQAAQAVLLLLDTYYIRDDLKGLVAEGNSLVSRLKFDPGTKNRINEIIQQAQLKNIKSLAGDFGSRKYASEIIKFAKSNKNSSLGETAMFEAFTALKSQNDDKIFEVGEDYIASFPKSNKVKEILLTMPQMALNSLDMRRAQRYLTAYAQQFPEDEQANNFITQAALIAEQSGDYSEASRIYGDLGKIENQADVLFANRDWTRLQSVATRINGVKGIYYSGISMYRLGNKEQGLNLLRRLQSFSASDFSSKNQMAHANYLLAFEELQNFRSVGINQSFTPALLKNKIQSFQEVDRQVQQIIKLGIGKWTLAALYLSGMQSLSMANYLNSVAAPAGMTNEQFKKIIGPQQIKYQHNSREAFSECLKVGEENDIFSLFVDGCRKQGAIIVSEERELYRIAKGNATKSSSLEDLQLRRKIFKEPRNINLIRALVQNQVDSGYFAEAMITLGKLQELEPANYYWKSQMGVVSLYMNDLELAFSYFQTALSKDTKNKTALWGLKALYKRFNYATKEKFYMSKLKSLGKPEGLRHPWMGN